ncbi:DUF1707 SHOCT-like domain-containing protein [Amycolatopsis anabasis]|uniref:DUF1707 SHOCT-like domain-containing protein n=1 Tax=Amycolatopsis anabasis TaxID=1840409 RepID=UPI00131B155E|nr:DUF1707 domain-containing protein [Amycolatopsis anabasis]
MGDDQARTGTRPLSPRDLRVSDAEREHVVGVLQKAIGRGMLDLDEFTERTDTALAARTRGELNAVLADLPGLIHYDARPASAMAPPPPPGFVSDRLELRAKGSNLVRRGAWVVPGELSVVNKFGSVELDFTEAQLTTPVVHIKLNLKWGGAELIVPEYASVDANAISEVKWGSLDDKTRSPGQGSPRFVLTGRVVGGGLTIRNPKRLRWGAF